MRGKMSSEPILSLALALGPMTATEDGFTSLTHFSGFSDLSLLLINLYDLLYSRTESC